MSNIHEEIGRNYSTADLGYNKPYSMMDNTDIDVNLFAMNDGKWSAEVKCISNPRLSTNLRVFNDEASASHWTRMQVDKITRKTMNETLLRRAVRSVIKEYFLM